MTLRHLISEAKPLPDLSEEVYAAKRPVDAAINARNSDMSYSFSDLEVLTMPLLKSFTCEHVRRKTVDLRGLETSFVKAKHAAVDLEDDFV